MDPNWSFAPPRRQRIYRPGSTRAGAFFKKNLVYNDIKASPKTNKDERHILHCNEFKIDLHAEIKARKRFFFRYNYIFNENRLFG